MTTNIYEDKESQSDTDNLIDDALTLAIYYILIQGFQSPDKTTQQNILEFAVFKNYHNRKDLKSLIKENPSISFDDFIDEAKPINNEYNQTWLKTEFNFVKDSSEFNSNWKKWKKNGVEYLEFKTKRDSRVRPSHAALDGIVLPMTDSFWKTHQTPLDWNCRCMIVPSSAPGITNSVKKEDKIEPMFRNNVALTSIVFSKKHPYFKAPKNVKTELLSKAESLK